ncbi:MAG TPA: hypothetical protein VF030_08400, partial [Solirubrobacterales bacterium]
MAARIARGIAGAFLVCCLVFPAVASAEEIPHVTSLTADPAAVKVGETTKITVTVSPLSLGYHVYVVNTDTGQGVAGCPTYHGTCSGEITVPWSENANPKDLHLEAEVVPTSGSPTGHGTPLTVDVQRVDWNISLKASKNPVTVGESTKLQVDGINPSMDWTGYHLKIFNDETEELLTTCWGHECQRTLEFPYSMQQDVGPIPIHAEVVRETPPHDVAGRADFTLYVDPIRFGIDISFSEPVTGWNGEQTWLATASASPGLYWTPFFTSIVNSSGGTEGTCSLWVACTRRLGAGTFRAIVKDEQGNVYAATPWWTVPPGSAPSEPREETADGLDLLALAALFPNATAACNAILLLPGTHLANSSVTDQYLACDAAVAAGASTTAALRAAAAAAGGTAILWLLWEEQTKEQTDPEQFEPEEPEETEPIPVPPIIWPESIAAEAETLQELNPEKASQREAQVTIKQCQRLVARAGLPTSRCTELPIFASGDLDVPQATKHDREAVLRVPGWVKLNYEGSAGKSGGGWYNAYAICDEEPRLRDCHEFPFFSTEQGGGTAYPRPSLKLIDRKQNRRQGSKLST